MPLHCIHCYQKDGIPVTGVLPIYEFQVKTLLLFFYSCCCWQWTSSLILSSASCSLRSRSTSSSLARTCSQESVLSDWLVSLDTPWGNTLETAIPDWSCLFSEFIWLRGCNLCLAQVEISKSTQWRKVNRHLWKSVNPFEQHFWNPLPPHHHEQKVHLDNFFCVCDCVKI